MRYRLLGPLEILDGDKVVRLGGPRRERLAAALLLRANRTAPLPYLVDAVWDGDSPANAVKQVRNDISALRAVLGLPPQALVTMSTGYRLNVDDPDLDIAVVEYHLGSARQAVAATQWDRALVELDAARLCWRGPALPGMTTRVLQSQASGLDEKYLTILGQLGRLHLQLGHDQQVISLLTAVTAEHPLREDLAEHLIRALHGCGRRADALAVYERTRRELERELAVPPSDRLSTVHLQLLRAGPAPDRPAGAAHDHAGASDAPGRSVPRQLPPPISEFVGRAGELRHLSRLRPDHDAFGSPRTVVITGDAGVGKTTLAVWWASHHQAAFADGTLYTDLHGHDSETPRDPSQVLDQLLRELGVPAAEIPHDLDARVSMYRTTLDDRCVLLILDNARDAAQVRPLLPPSVTSGCIITSRNRLAGLVARDGAGRITLERLPHDDGLRLLRHRIGDRVDAQPHDADELVHRCAGLPLALCILAERAAAMPTQPLAVLADQLAGDHSLDVLSTDDPATAVRHVISWSFRAMPADAQSTFRHLGLHPGIGLSTESVAALTGATVAGARRRLVALADMHLVTATAPGHWRQHDLLRAYARELAHEEPASRQDQAVRRYLLWLLHSAAAASDRLLNAPSARLDLPPTGHPSMTFADFDAATAWFVDERHNIIAAIDTAARGRHDDLAWPLAVSGSAFFAQHAHYADWVRTHTLALRSARRIGHATAQARLLGSLGTAFAAQRRYTEAVSHLNDALDMRRALDDRPGQGYTLLNLATTRRHMGQAQAALDLYPAAMAIFTEIGEAYGLAVTHSNLGELHTDAQRLDLARHHHQQALDMFRRLDNRHGEATTLHNLGYLALLADDLTGAYGYLVESLALKEANDDRYGQALTHRRLGQATARMARHGEADAHYATALRIFDSLGSPQAAEMRAELHETQAEKHATPVRR